MHDRKQNYEYDNFRGGEGYKEQKPIWRLW